MNDHFLVEALRRRDSGAPAAMYDEYADRLYAYCWFGLHSTDAAQVAVRDSFVAAEAHIERLREPDRFGPWLYALARLECGRRMAHQGPHGLDGPHGPHGPHGLNPGRRPDISIASHDQEDVDQRVTAWKAVTGLPPISREILELRVRHQLSVPDLAAVFCLPVRDAEDALGRAHQELEAALTAELLAHEGPHGCLTRGVLLRQRRGELTPGLRDRLLTHARQCEVCGGFRARTVSATKVYGLLPQARTPETLRQHVMSCFYDPDLVGYRLFVATRLSEFGPDGFPLQPRRRAPSRAAGPLGEGGRSFRRLAGVLALVGVVLVGLAGGTLVFGRLAARDGHDAGPAGSAGAGRRPTPAAPPSAPAPPSPPPPDPGSEPGSGRIADGAPGAVVGPQFSATFPLGSRSTAAPPIGLPSPPTPRDYLSAPGSALRPGDSGPVQGAGTLSASPLYLDLGGGSSGSIGLRAERGPVAWRARTTGPLRVSLPSGRLAAGAGTSVTVTVDRDARSDGEGTVTFEPGGVQVTVTWRPDVHPPGPSPTGPPPASPPAPTGSSSGSSGSTSPGTSSPPGSAKPPAPSPTGPPPKDPPSKTTPPPSSQPPPPSSSEPPPPTSSEPTASPDPSAN